MKEAASRFLIDVDFSRYPGVVDKKMEVIANNAFYIVNWTE